MASNKQKGTQVTLRVGTDLTYNVRKGSTIISRVLRDIEYIIPKAIDDVYLAISLRTGVTGVGETPDEAYSSLIFKLYKHLSDVVNTPEVAIGQEVSEELTKASCSATRMPHDRQFRALTKGIEAFLQFSRHKSVVCSRIEFPVITTDALEDTCVGQVELTQ